MIVDTKHYTGLITPKHWCFVVVCANFQKYLTLNANNYIRSGQMSYYPDTF